MNDWFAATIELMTFTTLATVLALPVVALPAEVLPETVALPLFALSDTLFVSPVFVVLVAVDVFAAFASSIALRSIGCSIISPFTSPITFETNVAACVLLAFVIVEFTLFKIVAALLASPVVALPAAVFFRIEASPLVATELSALAIVELVTPFVVLDDVEPDVGVVGGVTVVTFGL